MAGAYFFAALPAANSASAGRAFGPTSGGRSKRQVKKAGRIVVSALGDP